MKTDLRDDGRVILAHGEATGHCHEVVTLPAGLQPTLAEAQWFEVDGQRELIVLAPCELTHQEHSLVYRTLLFPDGHVERVAAETGLVESHPYPAQVRQGDVFLLPTSPGTWCHAAPREYAPGDIRLVAD